MIKKLDFGIPTDFCSVGGKSNLDLFYNAFSTYDIDHTGQLSQGKLYSALKSIEEERARINNNVPDYAKVGNIVEAVFADKQGQTIGFSEFLSLGQEGDGKLEEAAQPTLAAQTESEHWFDD